MSEEKQVKINLRKIIGLCGEEVNARHRAKQLADWGLVPKEGTFPCPKCGRMMLLCNDISRPDKLRWTCDKVVKRPKKKATRCHTATEFRHGTFFDHSMLPIWKSLRFAHLWCKGVALRTIGKECEIDGQHTLVDWSSFCREVVLDAFLEKGEKIGGPGKIVEIDESKFGKRKYHRGHAVEGCWVFGGYERGTGCVFMVPVEDRTKETLLAVIKERIEPGTTIYSDMWKAYNCLEDEGYEHMSVNHSLNFKDPKSGVHTNGIESSWRPAKSSMSSAGRVKHHIAGNLARYMFNRRCRELKMDATLEFFRLTGQLYNATSPSSSSTDDDEAPLPKKPTL